MKKRNIVFIIVFMLILFGGFASLFTEEKIKSIPEARNLNRFKHFSYKDYLDNSYQDHLEKTIMDQIVLSGTIKKNMPTLFNLHTAFLTNKEICENNYLYVGKGKSKAKAYTFDCNDYLIYGYTRDITNFNDRLLTLTYSYSRLNDISDVYYYYVQTSENYNFKKNKQVINVLDYFKEHMTGNYHIDELTFNSFEEYKNHFYKTDHHWNHKGAYEGYKAIHKLMNIPDEPLKPIKEKTYNIDYFGSLARNSRFYNFKEKFTVYKYDLPDYYSSFDKTNQPYGNMELYDSNKYSKNKYINHYGKYYGWDYEEVVFKFDNDSKENLLILSNSFSNSVNNLIASHFKNTYVIDLRYYKDFDVKKYIKDNNISKVLVLFDDDYILGGNFILNWRRS